MRILIGASDVCGIIHDLGEQYKKAGHEVVTVSCSVNKYYNYNYDIDTDNFLYSYLKFKTNSSRFAGFIIRLTNFFGKKTTRRVSSIFIRKLLSNTDCYIQIYNAVLWEEERQLSYLKKKKKKIITLFVGSEIRDYYSFQKKYNITKWKFDDEVNFPGRQAKEKKLRLHERYSDVIFSVPDQSVLAKRPYFHIQVPMKIEKFTFNVPDRDIPVVLHAPSHAMIKGSDLILETLQKLKDEGLQFELKLIENLSHDKLLVELSNADILVDEVILHGPGFLSFEAMLSGCAVATRYQENSPSCFKPPIVSINEYNIYEKLKTLLLDKDLRNKLANEGRKYALENNNIAKVADDIINKFGSDNFDYYPDKTDI